MKNRLKKYLSIITILVLVLGQSSNVLAQEAPLTPPDAPTAPVIDTTPPEAPVNTYVPPTPPPAPTLEEAVDNGQEIIEEQLEQQEELANEEEDAPANGPSNTNQGNQQLQPLYSATPQLDSGNQTGAQVSDGQTGNVIVDSGNATNNAGVITYGNSNLVGNGSGESSASVVNSGNGESSNNQGSVVLDTSNQTNQNNNGQVTNNLDQSTTSGLNSASYNNLGNSTLNSGDSNTTGTIVTALNTNVDGVAVAEFNVVDDQTGDIVLDFASGCISGCGGGQLLAQNINNGPNSNNDASIDQMADNSTFQNNEAGVENNMLLSSNSGDNTASYNNQGDTIINSGDANVAANALTFVNNNLAGNVIFTVVNIFGDLVGDIIFPEGYAQNCSSCPNDIAAKNVGNGPNSTNNADVAQNTNNEVGQFNNVEIENNLLLSSTTGANETSFNNGGSSTVSTGDSKAEAQVLNVANSNVEGGNWWLVIVNEAGNWIGKIMGAPEGTNFAGSSGTDFAVDENGVITATNSGNGAGSQNDASITSDSNSQTTQTNDAKVVNNLDLSANTGGNKASFNNGGSTAITTGDSTIVANLVNFVNNNISGNGKLFVTMVNVFGSWMGNFVTPDSQQEEEHLAQNNNNPSPQGGDNNFTTSQGGNNGGANNNSNQDNSSNAQGATNNLTNSSNFSIRGTGVITHNAAQITPQVAGFSESIDQAVEGSLDVMGASAQTDLSKATKINLAWLVLVLPLLLISYLIFKKVLVKRLSA